MNSINSTDEQELQKQDPLQKWLIHFGPMRTVTITKFLILPKHCADLLYIVLKKKKISLPLRVMERDKDQNHQMAFHKH